MMLPECFSCFMIASRDGRDIFVMTNTCCDKTFVATKLCLSLQSFLLTKDMFCHDKHVFVVAKVSLL